MTKIMAAEKIVSCVISVFLLTGVHAPGVTAGECDQLVAELSQIKSIVKRKVFLAEAVKDCDDDYRLTYYYAYNFERRRKYDLALNYYNFAITLNPEHAQSYFGLGDTYLVLRKNKEAVAAFEKGLQLEPGNSWAEKSLKKAKLGLPRQSVPKAASSPLTAASPETDISVNQLNGVASEKAVTVSDFIQRMRFDSATAKGTKDFVVQMPIQFNSSSGELTSQAKEQLDSVVCTALQSEELKTSSFEVAGHTDASGSFELNMSISRTRAHAVKQYLVDDCGIVADRISVVYYGESRPMVPNTSRKNRRLNRRVEFRRIIGKDTIMHRYKCPTELTIVASSVLGVYSGGLAEDYLPEQ